MQRILDYFETRENISEFGRVGLSYERLLEMSKSVGDEWVKLVPFEGKHEFCKDNAHIDALVGHLKEEI